MRAAAPSAMEGADTSMCIFYDRVAGENCVNGKWDTSILLVL